MDALNIAVGLMSLVLGGFSIWLALHFYERAKDSEKEVALTLEAIRVQGDSLQKLTARWMDRLTRHATEPRPTDEGLLALVSAVADLPTTILTTLRVTPGTDPAQVEPLRSELVTTYIALYYYSAVSNVALQGSLPTAADYDETNDIHAWVRRMIDSTAADFTYMAGIVNGVETPRLAASPLHHLLIDARDNWRPLVRTADEAFRAREGSGVAGKGPR
jgi:hypothetical protein